MDNKIHENIYKKLHYFYEKNKIPNIIFHGSYGTGKRTIVDNFLKKIYQNDNRMTKTNVMIVNCAHGKGIKFIREELKFFAKTNIQSNSGVLFKTIVLLNADNLTIDAQSALRRCIELFSSNTRFFIIVENKEKLLNPILSRFCEIYVPEHIVDGKIVNLHQLNMKKHMNFRDTIDAENQVYINSHLEGFFSKKEAFTHINMVDLAVDFYEKGLSCLDLIKWIENTEFINGIQKSEILVTFGKVKSEYRCEKLLFLYIFNMLLYI
jgi:replication-associated recombination protein RarA